MRFYDLINKKKRGQVLSKEELEFWIDGMMDGSIPDYQSSAMLMAIYFQGMSVEETSDLTFAMLHSGAQIDLSAIEGVKVDKHSTGGVGDKTTVVLSPMVAACGVKVAKMSGRGLGHTGGTLDKLESIPGYNFSLSKEEFIEQVNEIDLALIGQTDETVPADKTIYALRDVTATVDSLPLIAASIMSKKLASGADTILLDVKYGEGAFMSTAEEAEELAQLMIDIGESLGRNTRAMITNMNEPLGYTIGNSLEIIEAIECLKGNGPQDLEDLCVLSSAIMLEQAQAYASYDEAEAAVKKSIEDKTALEKLRELIAAQGGNPDVVDDYTLFQEAKFQTELKAKDAGYIMALKAEELGVLAMKLGAGRTSVDQDINHAVGLKLHHKCGDFVDAEQTLCTVYHDEMLSEEWLSDFYESIKLSSEHVEAEALVYKVL